MRPTSVRLDRQLRIPGWNQAVLAAARIGVVGDDDRLASLYVMSAAALGLNQLVVIAPRLEPHLIDIGRQVNPDLRLVHLPGYFTHPVLEDLFTGCQVLVDLSQYGLANKLLLAQDGRAPRPVIRGFPYQQADQQGFKVFTYLKGREWQELEQLLSPRNLPAAPFDDDVLNIIIAGLALEETKNILMGQPVSPEVIAYARPPLPLPRCHPSLCVVGAGALGNFIGLGLALLGATNLTFMDADVVEMTNLNRQVFLSQGLGKNKAQALSARLNRLFGLNSRFLPVALDQETDISPYQIIFDGVDNFETRIILSELCKAHQKILISGGSDVAAGQVVVYDPARHTRTPAELLGLAEIVRQRRTAPHSHPRASCQYRPDPAVIMTNQIIAGFMVEAYRRVLGQQEPDNIFYDASRDQRL
ncbi:MAG: ThiF family adenylyltransferase [Deltaproteobacteria bacterium]|nr:ThiF family adenylyltransferase [Deltaproteobacteria bacterium]